jgi:DNA primase
MKTRGVSFRFACEILQSDTGLVADHGTVTVGKDTTTTVASELSSEADRQTTLARVIDYYHATLQQSPEAHAYLERRGLNDPALITTFRLGFANRTLGYRLPAKNRKAGAEIRGGLQTIGLLRKSGHEHFNGSLVVPVITPSGEITEVYGRKIVENLRKGTAYHLYLPGPHRGVWNEPALAACDEIILCEALIDAMTFWVAGYRNVTASYGTGGYTADHTEAFARHNIKRVLIAYDRDAAGNAAAETLAATLNAAGIDAFRILLPKGMDVNGYACQVTPAAKSLGLAIRQAEWLGNGSAPSISTVSMASDALVEAITAMPRSATSDTVIANDVDASARADSDDDHDDVNSTHTRMVDIRVTSSTDERPLDRLVRGEIVTWERCSCRNGWSVR